MQLHCWNENLRVGVQQKKKECLTPLRFQIHSRCFGDDDNDTNVFSPPRIGALFLDIAVHLFSKIVFLNKNNEHVTFWIFPPKRCNRKSPAELCSSNGFARCCNWGEGCHLTAPQAIQSEAAAAAKECERLEARVRELEMEVWAVPRCPPPLPWRGDLSFRGNHYLMA